MEFKLVMLYCIIMSGGWSLYITWSVFKSKVLSLWITAAVLAASTSVIAY